MKLLKFEFRKFVSNFKNLVVVASLFFIVLAICLINRQQLLVERENVYKEESHIYQQLSSDFGELQKQKEISPQLTSDYGKAIVALENKLESSNSKEWRKSLKEENLFIDSVKRINKTQRLSYIPDERLQSKAENQFYLKNDIKPDNSLYGVSAMYYVRVVLSVFFSIYGYLFFLIIFYDIFLNEKENNNIYWLMTLPVHYKKITKSKIILCLLSVVSIFGVALVFTFVLGYFLTKRVGNMDYPMAFVNTNPTLLDSLPFNSYFLTSVVAFLLIICLILLSLSLSFRTKLSSEKTLLLNIVGLVTVSQFTKLLDYYPRYFLVINYIDLSNTILRLYRENIFVYHIYTIVILFSSLLLMVFFNLLKSKKKNEDSRLS